MAPGELIELNVVKGAICTTVDVYAVVEHPKLVNVVPDVLRKRYWPHSGAEAGLAVKERLQSAENQVMQADKLPVPVHRTYRLRSAPVPGGRVVVADGGEIEERGRDGIASLPGLVVSEHAGGARSAAWHSALMTVSAKCEIWGASFLL